MSKFDHKTSINRYKWIGFIITAFFIGVLAKATYLITKERTYWLQVADRVKKDSVSVKPMRGNILSSDEQLMASSLPEYKLYIDFKAIHDAQNDSLFEANVDTLAFALHKIIGNKKESDFKRHLKKGFEEKSRHWAIWNKRVSYEAYSQIKELPLFSLSPNRGGFHVEEFNARQRPFGSLAGRTVGDMYGAKDTARFGLELAYDSILRGTNGIIHRRKVRNKFLSITDTPPIDGADIVTTIDVNIQDLAERAVVSKLKEIDGVTGIALVMEVKTGDIKAIVNMEKTANGRYREIQNRAINGLVEPGSVFKTASILVALDEGVVDTNYVANTGNGIYNMHGSLMRDHNWTKGGFGAIKLPKTLWVSSNIGVSYIIDKFYYNQPERFVKGIYRTGLADNINLPLPGYTPARIRTPKKNEKGQWINWSKTSLAWMSIGYETQIPPIATLTFYNTIANGGKMMRPRIVKRVVKGGETIAEFAPEVMPGREQIAKPEVIKQLTEILEGVVVKGKGTAFQASSPLFKVAGKTGTAQISQGKAGYRSERKYLVSFAGFFPSDAPRYSCIVCITVKSGHPSGGTMAGPVFKTIAEGIMAQNLKLDIRDAKDENSVYIPQVKDGNMLSVAHVLSFLNIKYDDNWTEKGITNNPIWGRSKESKDRISLIKTLQYPKYKMPDVIGMGARDAVYMIESRGIKTRLTGRGSVYSQSIEAGTRIKRGMICNLELK